MQAKLISSLFFVLGLSACSMLSPRPRELVLNKDWVRQAWAGPYNLYRLAHLASPILYKDMVVQGNAIDGVSAYHYKTGHLLWRIPIENGVASGIQEYNGKLY